MNDIDFDIFNQTLVLNIIPLCVGIVIQRTSKKYPVYLRVKKVSSFILKILSLIGIVYSFADQFETDVDLYIYALIMWQVRDNTKISLYLI